MTGAVAAHLGLFSAAFLAATILPAQSEAVLAGLILAKTYPLWSLIAVASLGNVLGAVVNWGVGRGIDRFRSARWFPLSEEALTKARGWYRRWGAWSLLLSWAPVIGDPLTLVAGVMREPLWRFLLLVSLAKTGRYLILAAAMQAI